MLHPTIRRSTSSPPSASSLPRLALVGVVALASAACAFPRTDDLDRLDSGATDARDDLAPPLDAPADAPPLDAPADVPSLDAPDAPPSDATDAVSEIGMCPPDAGASFQVCGDRCVNTATDRTNCGGCNVVCPETTACSAGACQISCGGGTINCGGRCIDPRTNNSFCGATGDCNGVNAGDACAPGQVCLRGTCGVVCPSGQINCDGRCIDPQTDSRFCGATNPCDPLMPATRGAACTGIQVCAMGRCASACPSGLVNCMGSCVDPQNNPLFCGASSSCTGFTACPAGQVCSGGTCNRTCGTGTVLCDARCIDPATNRQFCGARGACTLPAERGTACRPSEICLDGRCVYFEPPESYISTLTDTPDMTFPLPVDARIAGPLPGTACYTLDGSTPNAGTPGTICAPTPVLLTGLNGPPTAPRTVRWYVDYGPGLGRELATHTALVRVDPAAGNSHGMMIDAVNVNGNGPVAVVLPGQSVPVAIRWRYWHANASGYCPGCISQVHIGLEQPGTTPGIELSCQLTGPSFPGTVMTPTLMVTAPMVPGRYALRTAVTLDFTCRPVSSTGPAFGYIIVR